jgi:phosphoribosylanthranilate isomerase
MAEDAGADAIGVVVKSKSPRNVPLPEASEILGSLGPYTSGVLVSHTMSQSDFSELLAVRPTAVQVSFPHILPEGKGIKMIRVVQPGLPIPADCDAVVIDTSLGSGKYYSPEFAKEVVQAAKVPVILAGGLNPVNVAGAIADIHPYAVDVATGVEISPGVKDPELVRAFIRASGRC